MDWFESWALTLAVFLPLVGVAIIGITPRANEAAIKAVALLSTLATFGVGAGLVANWNFDLAADVPRFEVNRGWIDVINSNYHVFLDGISLPLLLLSMLVSVLCVIYSWDHFPEPHNPKAFLI